MSDKEDNEHRENWARGRSSKVTPEFMNREPALKLTNNEEKEKLVDQVGRELLSITPDPEMFRELVAWPKLRVMIEALIMVYRGFSPALLVVGPPGHIKSEVLKALNRALGWIEGQHFVLLSKATVRGYFDLVNDNPGLPIQEDDADLTSNSAIAAMQKQLLENSGVRRLVYFSKGKKEECAHWAGYVCLTNSPPKENQQAVADRYRFLHHELSTEELLDYIGKVLVHKPEAGLDLNERLYVFEKLRDTVLGCGARISCRLFSEALFWQQVDPGNLEIRLSEIVSKGDLRPLVLQLCRKHRHKGRGWVNDALDEFVLKSDKSGSLFKKLKADVQHILDMEAREVDIGAPSKNALNGPLNNSMELRE